MTAPLSREQACDAYRKNCGGITVIERSAFESGWSARDAEVARLRAACEHVFAMIEVELYESPADDQWHIAAAKLRDAINKTEPTK